MINIEKGSSPEAKLPFEIENWIELGLGVVVILLRLYARAKVVGIRKWQADDFISIMALLLWAVGTSTPMKAQGLTCSRWR